MMRLPLFALVLIGVVAAAGAAIALGVWRPLGDSYVEGVDVSAHQGQIDWDALSRSNVRFAYIKATEGTSYVDPRFAANWRGAGHAGIRQGAYHRFSICRSPQAQANNFFRAVPRTYGALPPAVDVENMDGCGSHSVNARDQIEDFLDLLEHHYGVRPILYVTRQFHEAHASAFPHERFWLRSLYAAPDFRAGQWVIWQHHEAARRPGIEGPVDVNSFRGNARALEEFARETDEPHDAS
jgi:lysozyme